MWICEFIHFKNNLQARAHRVVKPVILELVRYTSCVAFPKIYLNLHFYNNKIISICPLIGDSGSKGK